MKKSYRKVIVREVIHTLSRFLAIFGIAALGVGFLAGLLATTPDMRVSTDQYYDQTNMFDVRVVSPLGLTDRDAEAIRRTDGVAGVMPLYSADALLTIPAGEDLVARVQSLPLSLIDSDSGDYQNRVILTEGRMPERPGEVVLETSKMATYGLKVGDTLTLSADNEDLSDTLKPTVFTVVGKVKSAYYFSIERDSSTVGNGTVDIVLYTGDDSFCMDVYTSIFVLVEGAKDLTAFSQSYDDAVQPLMDTLESLGQEQSVIRREEVLGDARQELADAQAEYDEQKREAEEKLADARQQLDDARRQIEDGEKELEKNRQKLQDGQNRLDAGKLTYESGFRDYTAGKEEWRDGQQELNSQKADFQITIREKEWELGDARRELEAAKTKLEEGKTQLDTLRTALEEGEKGITAALDLGLITEEQAQELRDTILAPLQKQYDENKTAYDQGLLQYTEGEKQVQEGEKALEEGKAEAEAQFAAAQRKLDEAKAQLEDAKAQLDAGLAEINDGEKELTAGREQIAQAEQQLEDAKAELAQGEAEYASSKQEADEKLADGQKQLDDAQDRINQVDKGEWVVLNRHSNPSYVSFDSNAEKVENIAKVFPIFFFLVAALVALTTMTRMVEEERVQIGTLKALGYSKAAIMAKYMIYAGTATVCGCIFGLLVGFKVFPTVIWGAYEIMYDLPPLVISFNVTYASLSSAAAILCTMLATWSACASTLREAPARLMLPKAPKAGKRVFLERIPFIWNHLSFTHKVTARNLIRYKKRFFMTVIGIAGCTALLLTGFGLRDSISDIVDKQFGEIFQYNLSVTVKGDGNQQAEEFLHANAEDTLKVHQSSADLTGKDTAPHSATLYVPGDSARLSEFIALRDRKSGDPVEFTEDRVLLTEKLADQMKVKAGDTITVKNADNQTARVTVGGITENYIQGYIYMSPSLYRECFDKDPSLNGIVAKVADDSKENRNRISTELLKNSGVASVSFTTSLSQSFGDMIANIDYIVMVLIVSAGLLAFVVLYNLTNINITERQKEIATLKVLGFYNREVGAYIFRETGILSVIGTGAGLILGIFLHAFVVRTAEVDMVMFGRSIYPLSFVLAALLTLAFSALVDLVMARKLKKIDMVESMKAGE